MGKCNRLCFLKMGKTRHPGLYIAFHDLKKSLQKILYLTVNRIDLITHIKLHIQGYLVITAPAGMQLLACIAYTVDQVGLHKAVDVFILGSYGKPSCLYIFHNAAKPFHDLILFFCCKNPLLCQHLHMGHTASDVLLVKLLVKRNRCIKIVYKFICFFCETSAPKLCHVSSSFLLFFCKQFSIRILIVCRTITFFYDSLSQFIRFGKFFLPVSPGKHASAVILPVQSILPGKLDRTLIAILFLKI